MARSLRVLLMAAVIATLGLLSVPSDAVAASGNVSISSTINGHKVSSSGHVRLSPSSASNLSLTVTNNTAGSITIGTVRIEGRVMGLVFYAYDTSVLITVAPHSSTTRDIVIDLSGLSGQATGLIPSEVQILDQHRNEIASQSTVVDVRGSIWSVYGLFGLIVLILTIIWSINVAVALARGRLHPNRWRRAMRFLVPGLGLGLVFVFTLSATRVVAPTPALWIPVVLGCAALLMAIGYLTPTPGSAEDDEDEDDDDERDDVATQVLGPRHEAGAAGTLPVGEW